MRQRIRALWLRLMSENASPPKIAGSVFTGIFLGVVPLYGIQTGICIFAAYCLRLNKVAVLASAQISMPFIAPFLLAGGLAIGEWIRFGHVKSKPDAWEELLAGILATGLSDLAISCLLGSIVLGAVLGAIGAAVAYVAALRHQRQSST